MKQELPGADHPRRVARIRIMEDGTETVEWPEGEGDVVMTPQILAVWLQRHNGMVARIADQESYVKFLEEDTALKTAQSAVLEAQESMFSAGTAMVEALQRSLEAQTPAQAPREFEMARLEAAEAARVQRRAVALELALKQEPRGGMSVAFQVAEQILPWLEARE